MTQEHVIRCQDCNITVATVIMPDAALAKRIEIFCPKCDRLCGFTSKVPKKKEKIKMGQDMISEH